jgi:hypothetical protein
MTRREGIIIFMAFVAAFAAVVLCGGKIALHTKTHPAVADNEDMIISADDEIVGASNTRPNPVSRLALANTRFLTGPLGMPMLRRTNVGGTVSAHILNDKE